MASANSLRVLSNSLDQQQVAMGSGMPVLDDFLVIRGLLEPLKCHVICKR